MQGQGLTDIESGVMYSMSTGNLPKNWQDCTRIKNGYCDDNGCTNQPHVNIQMQVYCGDYLIRNSLDESDEFISQLYEKFVDLCLGLDEED